MNLRENVISGFDTPCNSAATEVFVCKRTSVLIFMMSIVALVELRNLVGITKMSIREVASCYPVETVQRKVTRDDSQRTLHSVIFRANLSQRIAETVSVISTHSDAQTLDAVVIDTGTYGIAVCNLELVRTVCSVMNEIVALETFRVKSGEQLYLIAPLLRTSPQRYTHLMPCIRQDGILTLRSVNREELSR